MQQGGQPLWSASPYPNTTTLDPCEWKNIKSKPLQMFNKSVHIWGVKWRTVYNLHFRFCVAAESLVLVLLKHNLQSFVDSAMLGLSTTPWLAFWSFALLGILRSDLLWLGDFEIISKYLRKRKNILGFSTFAGNVREVVKRKRIFYGQADHKRWRLPPHSHLFVFFCCCVFEHRCSDLTQEKSIFWMIIRKSMPLRIIICNPLTENHFAQKP